jgi:hypothetical protein
MRTFNCVISADVFARLFELHIKRKAIKLDDDKLYEAHYGCCTFNTHHKNASQKIERIQLAPCINNKWPDDWLQHWFYVKVDMAEVLGRTSAFYPFYYPMGPMNAICTATFDRKTPGFMIAENRFGFACRILGGRDVLEEFVAARIWPITHGWGPKEIVELFVDWAHSKVHFPRFGLCLREDQTLEDFISEVEAKVCELVGEFTLNEYKAYKHIVKHKKRVNRVFSELGADLALRSRPPGPDKKMQPPGATGSIAIGAPSKSRKRKSSKKGKSEKPSKATPAVQPSKTKAL